MEKSYIGLLLIAFPAESSKNSHFNRTLLWELLHLQLIASHMDAPGRGNRIKSLSFQIINIVVPHCLPINECSNTVLHTLFTYWTQSDTFHSPHTMRLF